MRVFYRCDICNGEQIVNASIRGCNFTERYRFELDPPASTDGPHICVGCLDQISEQWTLKTRPAPQDQEQ